MLNDTELGRWVVRQVNEEDFDWIQPLFDANKKILGSFSMAKWRWQSGGKRTHWVAIANHAFAHFNVKRDGSVTLYEIAVHDDCKRCGMAREIMAFLAHLSDGRVELKTDANNAESNAFYRAIGFICVGQKATKSGKLVNIYQRFS